jgi:hypothetical protein
LFYIIAVFLKYKVSEEYGRIYLLADRIEEICETKICLVIDTPTVKSETSNSCSLAYSAWLDR